MAKKTYSGEWFLITDEIDCRAILIHAKNEDDAKKRYYEATGLVDEDVNDALEDPDARTGLGVTRLKDIVDSACSYHEIIQW